MSDKKEKKGMDMTRREFLKLTAAGAAGIAASSLIPGGIGNVFAAEKTSDSAYNVHAEGQDRAINEKIKIEAPKEKIRYDIIDNHLHYLDFLEHTDGFPALCEAMDMSGVSKAVIFGMGIAKQWDSSMPEAPSYYLSNDSRCYYYSATDFLLAEDLLAQPEKIRKRFFPFCCGFNCNDKFAADHVEQLLRLYPKFWSGIGEIMSRHDDLTALTYGEPPHIDGEGFLGIFDLAAKEGLPILVHHNITAQNTEKILYLEELNKALEYNKKCNIIWAHVGISRRVEVKNLIDIADKLLNRHKNLWIDISWLVYDYYFMDKFPNNYYDGDTLDDWVDLIEKHPDRFLVGTDKVGHWATYPAEVVKYYKLLDRLKDKTADLIIKDNILSLVKEYK
ncbi:MAG: twin-arginine translocation signal domain-containing protein [Lachnospiraceae bacterium]|nr:twin-arginine translocation signal domain-containing protein [Lachnospiraceae bacterium]